MCTRVLSDRHSDYQSIHTSVVSGLGSATPTRGTNAFGNRPTAVQTLPEGFQ